MAGIYGVLGVSYTERIFLNTLGQSRVYDAINEYMAMHNAELAATLFQYPRVDRFVVGASIRS